MKLTYLKSALKCGSIKILFLEFLLLLSQFAPYYSLLPFSSLLTTVRYHELLDKTFFILYGRLYFLLIFF